MEQWEQQQACEKCGIEQPVACVWVAEYPCRLGWSRDHALAALAIKMAANMRGSFWDPPGLNWIDRWLAEFDALKGGQP